LTRSPVWKASSSSGVGLIGVFRRLLGIEQGEVQLLEPDLLTEVGELGFDGVHLGDLVGRGQVLTAALGG
jgi:hypothetical protein